MPATFELTLEALEQINKNTQAYENRNSLCKGCNQNDPNCITCEYDIFDINGEQHV